MQNMIKLDELDQAHDVPTLVRASLRDILLLSKRFPDAVHNLRAETTKGGQPNHWIHVVWELDSGQATSYFMFLGYDPERNEIYDFHKRDLKREPHTYTPQALYTRFEHKFMQGRMAMQA